MKIKKYKQTNKKSRQTNRKGDIVQQCRQSMEQRRMASL